MMKATGVVRKIDQFGRIVLPIELRRTLDLEIGDALEIFIDDQTVILRKYEPACIFCGDAKNASLYKGRMVCPDCLKEAGKQ